MTTEVIDNVMTTTTQVAQGINPEFSPIDFFLCIGVAILLGAMISVVYGWSNPGTGQNFLMTLGMLTPVVSLVIIMVNGNVGTGVAVMGAFGLVRFRSVPGKGKEITAIFLAMAIGLAVGTGHLLLAFIATVILLFVSMIYQMSPLGKEDKNERILFITIPETLNYTEVFSDVFSRYTNFNTITEVKTTNMGSLFRLQYRIRLKNHNEEKEFIDALRTRNGNLEISSSLVLEDSSRL